MSFPFRSIPRDRPHLCKVFRKQKEAQEYLTSSKLPNLKLFSWQTCFSGIEYFLFMVCTAQYFWEEYSLLSNPSFFEVILQLKPCRLYFDVEYLYEFNNHLDGDAALTYFVTVVCEQLLKVYNLYVSYKDVIDLDSTTAVKFSRHLIFHLPEERLFIDNLHMGRFVDTICERLKCAEESLLLSTVGWNGLDRRNGHGMIRDSKLRLIPICDPAVYSSNRHFRLYLSSKLGKQSSLQLAESCCFYLVRGISTPSQQQIFEDSLISSQQNFFTKLLMFKDRKGTEQSHDESSEVVDPKLLAEKQHGVTDHPEIDKFVLNLASSNVEGNKTWIRGFRKLSETQLVYDIGGSRFCRNINREHKTNHVKYVVDMQKMKCYQMCCDPNCRDFVSNEFDLEVGKCS